MSDPEVPSGRPATSIASIVTLALVSVITLLLGIAGFIAYRSYSAARWNELHKNHRTLADQLAAGFASPLWNFDRPTLLKIAESAFRDETVTGLVVMNSDDGSIVHARVREGESGSVAVGQSPAAEEGLVEARSILFEGEVIGFVKVMATGRFVEAELRSILGRFVALILGLDLAVILGLTVLFRRIVLRPLQSIEHYAVAVSSGHRGDPSPLEGPLRGELSRVSASIVSMVGQLDARFDALERGRAELKQAYGDLARTNTELRQTGSELARSNGELQEFAYVASHDLQEPLRAVAGCVQLLQQRYQGKLDPKADELIGHAVDGAVRMQTLIEDLLTLSRVGTHARAPVPSDFLKIHDAALSNLSAAIRDSGAVVTHDDFPTVMGDPTQLTQLLQNLLSNAIKYRGPRKPEIHVGVRRQDGGWRFEVRDNGIGIESQYFERIFRLFQRLHTRREYPGTGIGLAVCKKIVDRHGGRIWVESEVGRGSSFFFTIPEGGTPS
jgi:signal transduction histidine kinase